MSGPELTTLESDRLEAWIFNHERLGATDKPMYRRLLEERNRRLSGDLEVAVTIPAVIEAAGRREYVTYQAVAKINDVEWSKSRFAMNHHLWGIASHCVEKDWPLLTALIVNQAGKNTGKMAATTLKGFVETARDLGYEIDDDKEFLLEQQEACFIKWETDGSEDDAEEAEAEAEGSDKAGEE